MTNPAFCQHLEHSCTCAGASLVLPIASPGDLSKSYHEERPRRALSSGQPFESLPCSDRALAIAIVDSWRAGLGIHGALPWFA
jgi:hypothetical protein